MKVGFSLNVNQEDADPGKHKFFIRLAREMRKNNVEIDDRSPDVYVRLAGDKLNPNAKLNVLRLDNVVLGLKKDPKKRNKKIAKSIANSDALIYQGFFGKELHSRFLGIESDKKYRIIPNGASPDEFLPRNVKNYFLANAKWRACKRLDGVVKSFLTALDMGLDSDLIITGKSKLKIKHPRIKYLTWQNKEQLKELLSGAIASLHLTWLDCCPNSMVEAIVAGCPVVYTRSGGLEELASGYGIGIEDKEWDYAPFDEEKPPKINIQQAAEAMLKIKNGEVEINGKRDLRISEICKQYIDFFREVL